MKTNIKAPNVPDSEPDMCIIIGETVCPVAEKLITFQNEISQ